MLQRFFAVALCAAAVAPFSDVHAQAADRPVPFVPTLSGWARMPAATFADGPTSGRFAGGREAASDNTEFIRITLPRELRLP